VTEIDDDTPASDFALASGLSAFTSAPASASTSGLAPPSDPTPAPTTKTAIIKRVKEQLI
jgi:hypothetical protein